MSNFAQRQGDHAKSGQQKSGPNVRKGSRGALGAGYQASCVDDPVEAGDLVCCAAVGCGHVSGLRGLRTAGPDAIRSLPPKQIYALEWRITLDGFFQAPGSTGSHHATIALTHPSAVAAADRGSFGFRLRHLGLLPACDKLLHARAKPMRSARMPSAASRSSAGVR